jgi:hypothetical protein
MMAENQDKDSKLVSLLAAGLVGRDIVTREAADAEDFDVAAAVFETLDGRAAENAALKRQLAAQKGQTTRARSAAAEIAKPAKPRALGPVEDQAAPALLLSAILAAEVVEIAFSDGETELPELAPQQITGSMAWDLRGGRLCLQVPSLLVHGPRPGDAAIALLGYALLLDGEQVAWFERGEQLTLGAGAKYELRDDVSFG